MTNLNKLRAFIFAFGLMLFYSASYAQSNSVPQSSETIMTLDASQESRSNQSVSGQRSTVTELTIVPEHTGGSQQTVIPKKVSETSLPGAQELAAPSKNKMTAPVQKTDSKNPNSNK